jgi:hypothetical protein
MVDANTHATLRLDADYVIGDFLDFGAVASRERDPANGARQRWWENGVRWSGTTPSYYTKIIHINQV